MRKTVSRGAGFLVCVAIIMLLSSSAVAQKKRSIKLQLQRPLPVEVQFTDMTASTGIKFQHASATEDKYIVMAGGVLLLDYDGDGWLDIYFTNAPSVAMFLKNEKARSELYRNNHDGTFSDVTDKAHVANPCWAMGGAIGDYNNDGWPDIYVTCLGNNVLYRNNGNGTFTDVTAQAGVGDAGWSAGAAFADYDGDGDLDLFVSNYVERRLEDLPKLAAARLCPYRGLEVECGPRGLKGAGDSFYRNNGDGTFTNIAEQAGVNDPHAYFGLGVIWSDFDDDGRPDLYVADDATPNYLYRNSGNKGFTEIGFVSGTAVSADGTAQAGMGVAVCDYLHNGRFSIYVTNYADEYNTLYANQGSLNFEDATYSAKIAIPTLPYLGWGTACTDFDNDGWADLFVVNGHVYPQTAQLSTGKKYKQRKLLYLNDRDGTFREAGRRAIPALSAERVGRGAAFGDLDNDGDTDVVIENIDGAPTVLRNDTTNGNHWITVRLAAARSNKLAIGAKVKITAENMTQIDEVRSGGSYLSQNDFRIHFGLGTATRAERIEVRWPSGAMEAFRDLAADRFYVVTEAKGIAETKP